MAKDKDLLMSNTFKANDTILVQSNGDIIPDNIAQKLSKMTDEITDMIDDMKTTKGSYGNFFMDRYISKDT